MEANKELLELLQKIEKANRQQVKLTRLVCIFALIAALCCGCTVALIYGVLPRIDAVVGQMQTVLSNLEAATSQLSVMDFTGMVEDVDALVVAGQQSLELTMKKLNTLDIAALNKAISDLSGVVEPLAKFFSAFTR